MSDAPSPPMPTPESFTVMADELQKVIDKISRYGGDAQFDIAPALDIALTLRLWSTSPVPPIDAPRPKARKGLRGGTEPLRTFSEDGE